MSARVLIAALAALAAHKASFAAAKLPDVARALRVGRYEEARRIACKKTTDAAAIIACAEAETALGAYSDARRRLESAAAAHPDDLPVRDALMRLYAATGERAALAPLIDATYEDWNGGHVARDKVADLLAVATAVRLDGNWKDANDVLRDAVRADAHAVRANLDWGNILLEKHNADDALACFRAVLDVDRDNPDAHVGVARAVLADRYDAGLARAELARALAVNPAHAGARALRAELALDAEDWTTAEADIAALRRTNPHDPGAARVAAAAAILRDDAAGYARERDRALAVNAGDGHFFAFVAEALTRHRRYDDARAIAEAGVRADPDDAACLAALATTLLRLGDEAAGLEQLRRAWKRDPYDVRTFNLLNLFEKVIPARYTMVDSAHLRFRVPPGARAAIVDVVSPFLEQRYADYVARYGVTPHGPVTFELYADEHEFAVRTVGLPTIGVTGVCFGRVITSQSPTNHAFNWGMVLAHELAHVFAIELSRSRVPRWFTEGLSEVETMRARPEWARHDDVALWGALARGELLPMAKLSDGFINAQNGDEAARAYAHAALAVEFLERRFGFAAIREALLAYGRGERDAAVLQRTTKMSASALDDAFRDDLRRRLARYDAQWVPTQAIKAGPVHDGLAALGRADLDGAERALAKARATSPASAETLFLAGDVALARKDADAAVAAFEGILATAPTATTRDGYDVRVRLALAEIHRNNAAAAEAHLKRAVAFDPSRLEPHALLAELYGRQQRSADRLTELAAAVRLDPQTDAVAKEAVLGAAKASNTARVVELAPIAIFIDPADADLHAALGRALAASGKRAAAAAAFERALAFHPHDPAALHLTLAALYDSLGDRSKAAAHRAASVR